VPGFFLVPFPKAGSDKQGWASTGHLLASCNATTMTEHADQNPDATGHGPSPSSKRSASLTHDFPFEQIPKQCTIGITQRHLRQLTPQ